MTTISLHFHGCGAYQISPISIRLENDPSMAGRFDAIDAKLNQLTSGQQAMAATAQELAQQALDGLAGLKDRADAAHAQMDHIHQLLLDAQATAPTEQLQQIIDQVAAIRQSEDDAITRNADAPAPSA